jgi:hypothetical protein
MTSDPAAGPRRSFSLVKTSRWSRSYQLRGGGLPHVAMHQSRLGYRTTVELGGESWIVRSLLVGMVQTVVRQGSGEVLARKRFRTLDVTGGPRLRWRPRSFSRPSAGYSPPDDTDALVAEFTPFHGSTMQMALMTGSWHVDMVCAVVGGLMMIQLSRAHYSH